MNTVTLTLVWHGPALTPNGLSTMTRALAELIHTQGAGIAKTVRDGFACQFDMTNVVSLCEPDTSLPVGGYQVRMQFQWHGPALSHVGLSEIVASYADNVQNVPDQIKSGFRHRHDQPSLEVHVAQDDYGLASMPTVGNA